MTCFRPLRCVDLSVPRRGMAAEVRVSGEVIGKRDPSAR
jgi:hypothetical protein